MGGKEAVAASAVTMMRHFLDISPDVIQAE